MRRGSERPDDAAPAGAGGGGDRAGGQATGRGGPGAGGTSEEAFIALGSNLGDRRGRLAAALAELRLLGRVTRLSGIYRTAPHGVPGPQPDYLNAVLALEPAVPWREPLALLAALLAVEQRHGRSRRERWAARTLDLDLLAFGDRVLSAPELELPHPRMMERAFVLAPLCEIAPEWRHPLTGHGACDALAALPPGGVERTGAEWAAG